MAGSNVIVSASENQELHQGLTGRDWPNQHPLESVYDRVTGQDLKSIVDWLKEQKTTVICEYILIEISSNTLVLQQIEFNPEKDELYVSVQGVDVFEGTDKDYVKIDSRTLQFSYELGEGYEIFVMILGTVSQRSFGDSLYTSVNRFTQLTDTPETYYGEGNKAAYVNDEETGIVFKPVEASRHIYRVDQEIEGTGYSTIGMFLPFPKNCMIRGIKLTPEVKDGSQFKLSLFTDDGGKWVYHSGKMQRVIWDIMEIPYVVQEEKIYVTLENLYDTNKFALEIYLER